MRRGLLSWSHQEIPPEALKGAVVALGKRAAARGLDGVITFADSDRPAALSRLTHLVPSWSICFLFVTPDGQAELVIGNGAKRNIQYYNEVSRLDSVHATGDFGAGLAARAKQVAGARPPRLGVIDLEDFPAAVLASLRLACPGIELVDVTGLFNATDGEDDSVLRRLGAQAAEIARASLAAGLKASQGGMANAVVAATDGAARLAGAEDTFIAIAPDALADPRLRRVEAEMALGPLFALQISLAYKGQWVRLGRTLAPAGRKEPEWTAPLNAWLALLIADPDLIGSPGGAMAKAMSRLPGIGLEFWRIEGAAGTLPLAGLAGSAPLSSKLSPIRGAASLSLRLKTQDGAWFAAEPLALDLLRRHAAA